MEFQSLGKWLVGLGLFLVMVGATLHFLPKIPWLGKLPGDLYVKKENFSFYFPLTTCLLLSLLVSLVFRFFRK